MSVDIFLVFSILILALVFFLTGWVRMDIVALSVLCLLAVTGIISAEDALSGFSNPAVITVWAMFILSASIYQTGVARILGAKVLQFAGKQEWRIIFVIMIFSSLLSTVMSNIGVAALMLPVVMDVSRSTGRAPARLLIPLAFAAHLGGLTTLIGSPGNLLISFQLEEAGYAPLGLFDFTPVAGIVMLVGVLSISLAGRYLLPYNKSHQPKKDNRHRELTSSYHLEDSTFQIRIKPGSPLAGKTLAQSRFRAALGINVLSIKREDGGTVLNPGPTTLLKNKDKLFVQGNYDTISDLRNWSAAIPSDELVKSLSLEELDFFEVQPGSNSTLLGKSAGKLKHAHSLNIIILSIVRNGKVIHKNLRREVITVQDKLLILADKEKVQDMVEQGDFQQATPVAKESLLQTYQFSKSLFILTTSAAYQTLKKTANYNFLTQTFGLVVLGELKNDGQLIAEKEDDTNETSRPLLVYGDMDNLPLLQGLFDIEIFDEQIPGAESLETEKVIMAEAVLAPRSNLAGKTLSEINFRKKYGLNVLAFWREGKAIRTHLHDIPLRFGETLLLYGRREKITLLSKDENFILLTDSLQPSFRTDKALTAVLILMASLLLVITGLLPLAISAIMGVILMVITGCLRMEEAYNAIDWRSVFLIAGMLPLGAAIGQTGGATLIAAQMEHWLGDLGPMGLLAGLYLLTLIATLAIHPAALVVIMAPVVIQTAENFGVSPHSFMIAIAIAASGSFLSPVAHPANLLVMGPGGYKFTDYLKIGVPFSLLVMLMVFLLIPLFWPL